jgi:glycosyltransferase involved in cell wall biosynthesis
VGLSVVDALCTGLPVLTTDVPIHSPEIEYLEHGVNAVVTPFDAQGYAHAVVRLLTEPDSYQTLVGGVQRSAEAFSVDAMVESIAAGVLACLANAGKPLGQDEAGP